MDTNAAIDLSLRSVSPGNNNKNNINFCHVPVVRPIPRPPWAILWYQSLWALHPNHANTVYPSVRCQSSNQRKNTTKYTSDPQSTKSLKLVTLNNEGNNLPNLDHTNTLEYDNEIQTGSNEKSIHNLTSLATVLDIACCDGPVAFEKVSNPNFALTVEHNESSTTVDELETEVNSKSSPDHRRHLALKTYLCIYCNQSFKSLFCYQKHKKRHLNPVSVDITATTHAVSNCFNSSENKAKTKDLNVQFFPCKKCGCKFPSYYFVHKHRKVCH